MKFVRILILLLILSAVFIFALQNRQGVPITFLSWGVTLPVPALILLIYLRSVVQLVLLKPMF